MTTQTVAASEEAGQPDPFTDLAGDLHRIADDIAMLAGTGRAPSYFHLNIQPGLHGDGDATRVAVDNMALALLGNPGQITDMSNGTVHYDAKGRRGRVAVDIYQSVPSEWAERVRHELALADREAELAKLRAEVATLRAAAKPTPISSTAKHYETSGWGGGEPGGNGAECACGVTFDGFDTLGEALDLLAGHIKASNDETGLGYSREADDPTPVSPARVPMHTGAVVDGGRLVRDDAVLVGPTAERSCRHLALANSIAMFDDTQFVEDDPCDQPAVYATTVLRGNEIYARTCRAHDAQFRVVEGYVGSVALP